MAIKARARLTFVSDDNLPGAFGQGIALLMDGVEEEHSLNRAAKRMGMAYSKAWRIIKEAEGQLGYELLARDGARGSTLTPEGKRALEVYWSIKQEVTEILERRVHELELG
ncbi:LysR family transcriptional regulator [Collinsella tanakaei]|uniref:LysR family transcriptional regulator n=1 Tax=Collinsella ihumii TaxID=1720204 RepID=A0A921LR88_9ACTN|nr:MULTISPECIES: LysR family transcriptional regulator [Collinsella]MBM6688309.1 LysR family transcriptional regulator [Collinsella tanakaei]MBM6775677.1 LysR family transcriptional regulator [Collinsella tanakaei]MBM6785774.1 LysR family transcriptional regulator [Collinsella tanakaei]MBM6906615.1 LysR family transcriptional regulator [Collinsella tanakaei]MCF6414222.1 LysR family transcriptional regulator [Collinsella tanakaei]